MDHVLGIDLGGTSLRAGLVAPDGRIAALAARRHRIEAEAEPEDWWRALLAILGELDLTTVRAVALSGFTRSQVFTDEAGMPVRPALCFPDGRATKDAAAIATAARGTWTEMTAFHPLARLRYVQRTDPEGFAATRLVLQPKDWLGMRLTGEAAADRISNAWALDRKGRVRDLAPFRRAGIDAGLIPILLDPTDRLGTVRGIEGLEGVPVFPGGMDTWCASVGAGAGRAGDAYIVSGTTDAAGVLADEPLEAPGLVTLPWGQGMFHTGGPSGAGADCLEWLAELLGMNGGEAVAAMATAADPAAPPLLFLPALSGERAPTWQPAARGAFIGLDRRHGPPELARAVMEGVAFADRDLLGGLGFARLLLTGGGARSDLWCRIRAAVLGCPVQRAATAEPGVLGAALVGWTGLGRYASLAEAQAAASRDTETFNPRPAEVPRYEALYGEYKRAQAACLALSEALARP
jgi:xylulokinase